MKNDVNTEIRKICKEEIAALNNLRLSVIKSDPKAFSITLEEAQSMQKSDTSINEFLERTDGVILGCWLGDKLLGMVGAEVCFGKLANHKARIFGLYVLSTRRRNGLGRSLVDEILKYVKSWPSVEKVVLETTDASFEAIALYKSLGFSETKIERKAFKHGETYVSAVHMEALLSDT